MKTGIPEIDGIGQYIKLCAWRAQAYAFSLGCRMDLQDLIQVGQIKAWTSYQNRDSSRCKFLSFCGESINWAILREVHNNCSNIRIPAHRWEEGMRPFEHVDVGAADIKAEESYELQPEVMAVNEVLQKLPTRQRVVLTLRGKGYTLQQIGTAYQLTREMIRVVENQALQTLKGQFQKVPLKKIRKFRTNSKRSAKAVELTTPPKKSYETCPKQVGTS